MSYLTNEQITALSLSEDVVSRTDSAIDILTYSRINAVGFENLTAFQQRIVSECASEIAGFLTCTLTFTLFPFAADKAAKGENVNAMLLKTFGANALFCAMIALPFLFCGRFLLSLLPHGDQYAAYWWAVPWLIALSFVSSIIMLYSTAEISANRFGYLKWYLPLDFAYPIALLLVTGHGYFSNIIPTSFSSFLSSHNIYSLETMLWWMTANNGVKALSCLVAMTRNNSRKRAHEDSSYM